METLRSSHALSNQTSTLLCSAFIDGNAASNCISWSLFGNFRQSRGLPSAREWGLLCYSSNHVWDVWHEKLVGAVFLTVVEWMLLRLGGSVLYLCPLLPCSCLFIAVLLFICACFCTFGDLFWCGCCALYYRTFALLCISSCVWFWMIISDMDWATEVFQLSKFLVYQLLSELCVFDYLPLLELACGLFHRNIRLLCLQNRADNVLVTVIQFRVWILSI